MVVSDKKSSNFNNQIGLSSKLYWQTFVKALGLTIRNIHALILIELYVLTFYVGCYLFLSQKYIASILVFALFTFFISSTFYMIGQIVKTGKFYFRDLFKSYKILYVRANSMLLLWYFVFILLNYVLITPISAVIKGNLLLYGITIPMILLIFLMFNSLPEAIYASEESFESLFMDSINFIEKYWFVWLVPVIVIMFLLNITDHRFSIMPTLGYLDLKGTFAKILDIAFYLRSFLLTIALIFRGLLYTTLIKSDKIN